MKTWNRAAALILAAVLSLSVLSPAAAADAGEMTRKSEFHTSASPQNDIVFTISGSDLLVEGQLNYEGLDSLMVTMKDNASIREVFPARSGEAFSQKISLASCRGRSPLTVFANAGGGNTYWSYLWQNLYVNTDGQGSYWLEQNSQALSFARSLSSACLFCSSQ